MDKKNGVLIPFEKGLIIRMKMVSTKVKTMQSNLQQNNISVCDKTIYNVWQWWNSDKTISNEYVGNSGRTKILTKESEETLIQYVTEHPTYSRKKLERSLQNNDYSQKIRPQKLFMTKENATQRLKWCKQMLMSGRRVLDNTIYSDESWIYYSHVHKQYYQTKNDQEIEYKDSQIKQKWPQKVMVWASIHKSGPLKLYFIEGNMNQSQYLYILEFFFSGRKLHLISLKQLFLIGQLYKSQNSNDRIIFSKNNINLIQWPTHSPDLSPLEKVWFVLKNKINHQINDIDSFEQFKQIIENTFSKNEKIKEYIQNCIRSLPNVLSEVVSNKGYPK